VTAYTQIYNKPKFWQKIICVAQQIDKMICHYTSESSGNECCSYTEQQIVHDFDKTCHIRNLLNDNL